MWGCACITEIKTKLSTVAVTLVHNSRHNGVGSELKVGSRLNIRNLDKQNKKKKVIFMSNFAKKKVEVTELRVFDCTCSSQKWQLIRSL